MEQDCARVSQQPGARTSAMLDAACDLFLEHGFSGVSVNSVIAKAGGSKRDLYSEFGGKEGLFRRVIAGICQEVLAPLETLPMHGGSVEEALVTFGKTFVAILVSPRVVSLQRLVASEASRYPEFARDFLNHGPSSAYSIAAAILTECYRRGEIRRDGSEELGAIFCDMLVADLQFRAMAGEVIGDEIIEAKVRLGVDVFLLGMQAPTHT